MTRSDADSVERPTGPVPTPDPVVAALRALRRCMRLEEMLREAREHLGTLVTEMTDEERAAFGEKIARG